MDTPAVKAPLAGLQARLPGLMARDQHRLRRRMDTARRLRDPRAVETITAELTTEIEAAELRLAGRRDRVPEIRFPEELPVSRRRDDIRAAIRDHQIVIIAGETGSGKTTQIPKICLELGRGVQALIGHTQPRRIAARTVAERIAEELNTPLGEAVGYKVRFTDRSGDSTYVKLMTDGILLAEIQQDRMLRQYDTLIIDEAHERSLNIDFLLGYLKQLLPRRPDLKVIITSATIDPERFSQHFDDAPIIEVSGRTYPVEVRYRPLVEETEDADVERDQIQAICDAVEELQGEGPGDILVFLSGEREIRDTAEALGKINLLHTEILPLYARLSSAEQHRVFQSHPGRRVVLATNVAETSLTVPGIRYVIDPGTARISRYSSRLKVQRLPIEAVSQASANQRKGRCGRVAEGICIRLYSEEDFLARPEFTDPEILRTNLASVILQMTALGLGDIAAFPFVEPPDRRNINDGVQLLDELGALEPITRQPETGTATIRLTPLGRKLAQLPVDPRLARMVVEADRNGCVAEAIVIAAALSIQDPRERPAEKQQAADEKHGRFTDKESDFVSYLNLWRFLREQQRELSSSGFRRMCRTDFLNYLRVREWQDLVSQLRQVAKTMGVTVNDPPEDAAPDADRVHQSLLAGLLSHVGLKEGAKNEYLGARGAKFALFPGSALFRKPPRFVMAAELVETSRLWGRIAARVEPEWAEALAGHLVKRNYSEPHWEKKQGAVMAYEKVTLYGVPLVANRKVNYGRIDPPVARELFIRHALVEGDWTTHHRFFNDNHKLLEEVEELEHRARRRGILVDDETLFAFYDARIPAEVVSAAHFDSWWKKTRHATPELLTYTMAMLLNEGSGGISERDYPDVWPQDGVDLRLTYQFEPGSDADGVTVHIPLPVLNRVTGAGFDWQVPGLREELVTALLRSLPKAYRRSFVPVPDYAGAVLGQLSFQGDSLLDALERELRRISGVAIPRDAWDLARVPDHLRMTYRIVGEDGAQLGEGKDLAALKAALQGRLRQTLAAAASGIERRGLREWTLDSLPRTVSEQRGGYVVTAYPALVDEGDSVAVRAFETEAEQRRAMWRGTRRLLQLQAPSPAKFVQGRMGYEAKLALTRNPHGGVAPLLDDCAGCAVDKTMAEHGGPAWDADGFNRLRDRVRADFGSSVLSVLGEVQKILAAAQQVDQRLSRPAGPALLPALTDLRTQLNALIYKGFVTDTGWARLPDLPRYLKAMERRLDRLPDNPARDRQLTQQIEQVQDEYRELVATVPADGPHGESLDEIRWMIEELRVNLFAQALGTPYPISEKRIYRAMDDIAA